jgi:sarcosine oxidase subunit alpha
MGAMEVAKDGVGVRLARFSYSGERAYEVYAPASRGLALWEHVLRAGGDLGLRPYGVEALGALRIEKGHVAGPEIDGRTTLADLGLERMASRTKAFVGGVLANRPAMLDPTRPRLVGLECVESDKRLRSGAVLFAAGEPVRGHGSGRISSTTFSPTLGKWIGLGFYAGGMAHEGEEIVAAYPVKGELVRARIVSPIFLDPKGERLRG